MYDQPTDDISSEETTDSDTPWNYFHIPPISPREALQPVIDNYRSLRYINRPLSPGDRSDFLLFTEQFGERLPEDPTDAQRQSFERSQRGWQAERRLEAIYLDCGWDVRTAEQTNFRRDEFLRRRSEHIRNVVGPLERR
jgi:hypothetical protein